MSCKYEIDIKECVRTMQAGGIILYPTDTVWGLGCDARNSSAVSRLFALKNRPDSKAMLLLVADRMMLTEYVDNIPNQADMLLQNASRPTTIIYKSSGKADGQLVAADGTIGIRIPNDKFCRELCKEFGGAIVSTSANISGGKTANVFEEIRAEIRDAVDYVCLSRREETNQNPPSAIYKIQADGNVITIRE